MYHVPIVAQQLDSEPRDVTGGGKPLPSRFRPLRPLGRGALATVWAVADEISGETLALKLAERPDAAPWLRHEYSRLSQLRHPGLPRAFEYGRLEDGREYFSMERVEGVAWADATEWSSIQASLPGVLAVLQFLHRFGLAHGDVTEHHVLVDADTVRLIDLSGARSLDGSGAELSGTPRYMAPELLRGEAGASADLFALGETLRALTRRLGPMPSELQSRADELVADAAAPRERAAAALRNELGANGDPDPDGALLRSRFVGREDLLQLALVTSSGDGLPVLWLWGSAGSGKRRFAAELHWRTMLERAANSSGSSVMASCDEADPISTALARGSGATRPCATLTDVLGCREAFLSGRDGIMIVDAADSLEVRERALLDGLVDAATAEDRCRLVVLSEQPPPSRDGVIARALSPLQVGDVASFTRGTSWEAAAAVLWEASEARPGAVVELTKAPAVGSEDVSGLRARLRSLELSSPRRRVLGAFAPATRRALSFVVAHELPLSSRELATFGVEHPAMAELSGRGFIRHSPSGWTLADTRERQALRRLLPKEEQLVVHQQFVDALSRIASPSPTEYQCLAQHLAAVSDWGRLARLLTELLELGTASRGLRAVARTLAEASANADERLVAVRFLSSSGASQLASRLLEQMSPGAEVRLERARADLFLGNTLQAGEWLRPVASDTGDGNSQDDGGSNAALRYELLARVELKSGNHKAARDAAQVGSRLDPDNPALLECLGVAHSYLGAFDEAEEHLQRAKVMLGRRDGRSSFRMLGYLGINAYRSGKPTLARGYYQDALTAAERLGLDDQLATAQLNLGTADHLLGRLASALAAYQKGARIAGALSQSEAQVKLDFNQCKLLVDVGDFEGALALGAGTELRARNLGLRFFSAATLGVMAEAARLSQREHEALELIDRAHGVFCELDAPVEQAAVDLERAACLLSAAPGSLDREWFEQLQARIDASEQGDMRARWASLRAELALFEGEPDVAMSALEQALQLVLATRQLQLQAELETRTSEVAAALGRDEMALRFSRSARARWEKVARDLPAPLLEAFWNHPARRPLRDVQSLSVEQRLLERLLDINRGLSASKDPKVLIERVMDAAIDLAGAERGFLILKLGVEEPRVAAARNFDGERLPEEHIEFSRGIALSVMNRATPVLSVDAQSDERFMEHRSVHEMRLRSVLAVPVCTTEGAIGALYLDNRFREGRFSQQQQRVLRAFADQAAIALTNAHMIDALQREQAKVRALLAEQTEEIERLTEQTEAQRRVLQHRYDYASITGRSASMQRLFQMLDRVTESDLTLLIQGESGTGKELIARAIHFNGPRSGKPFIPVNCAALQGELIESELFGHERGAFTGATSERRGVFERADGGTLLLDEIGEMPLPLQAKLLRALQEGRFARLGGNREIAVDVRVVGATHRSLKRDVVNGRFREDLYYRLAVVEITVPPLRERSDDIPELVQRLLQRICEGGTNPPPKLNQRALVKLLRHDWPGNVRELENVLRRACVMADEEILPNHVQLGREGQRVVPKSSKRAQRAAERVKIESALDALGWNVKEASEVLGIPRATLYRKLQRHGLKRPR